MIHLIDISLLPLRLSLLFYNNIGDVISQTDSHGPFRERFAVAQKAH